MFSPGSDRCVQVFDRENLFFLRSIQTQPGPRSLALDQAGNVIVSCVHDNCIQVFSSSGNLITQWQRDPSQPHGGVVFDRHDFFPSVKSICVDDEGRIHMLDRFSRVFVFAFAHDFRDY